MLASTPAPDPAITVGEVDTATRFVGWGGAVLAILLIVLTATDRLGKVFGRVGEIQLDRINKARRIATEQDDGDIAELRRVADNLRVILEEERSMLEEERAVNNLYRTQAIQLYQYILAAQRDPSKLNDEVPKPVDEEAVRSQYAEQRKKIREAIRKEKEEK